MFEIFIICALIIAISVVFLCLRILLVRDGKFPSQHIHDSKAMQDRGIHCVVDQDREARRRNRLAVDERSCQEQ